MIDSAKLPFETSLNDPDLHSRSQSYEKLGLVQNLCNHSIVKWHEVAESFVMVDMTAKKFCKSANMNC